VVGAPSVVNANLVLYTNGVTAAFRDNSFNFSSRKTCDTSTYVSPSCSYAIAYNAQGAIEFVYQNGSINPAGYRSLDYNLNTGGLPLSDFGVTIAGSKGNWINEVFLSPANVTQTLSGGWVHISLPLSMLDPQLTGITYVDLENALNKALPTIHVDDVQFVGA
jgi:hypothetical protein